MAILGQITVDELLVISVDADPSLSLSVPAPIGSIALLDDDTNGRMWVKSGAANNAWSIIPRMGSATALSSGAVLFADSNGFITGNTGRIFWDQTNNRLGLGLNAPAVPQSTIHLDRGTGVGVHIRFTAGTTTGQAAGDGLEIGIDDSGNAEIRNYENNPINFYTNSIRYMRLEATGELVLGPAATRIDISGIGTYPVFQITGTAAFSAQMAAIAYSADANPAVFNLLKSRGVTVGSQGLLSNNDELGRLQFRGSDGVNFQAGASVRAAVDGTPAAGSMPGRLLFLTTPTGSTLPVERMRIDALGQTIFSANIRLGAQVDTTDGNMQYTGSEFQARVAGVWRVIAPTAISLNATGTITTTSGTYSTMSGITTTPAAGTYLAIFSCNASISTDSDGDIALHIAGVEQLVTRRNMSVNTGTVNTAIGGEIGFMTLITVNGSQIVDVRFRENGGATMTVNRRELILIPQSR